MKRIRGKKLTTSQCQAIEGAGYDPGEYLMKKIGYHSEDSGRRASKNSDVIEIWEIIHRETGEIVKIYP